MNETPKQSKQTSASLAGTFEPSTSLEKTIDSLLRESGLRSEKEIASFEDLALKTVSIDEVRHRQAQLRAMRELMFRQDLKAKRIATISPYLIDQAGFVFTNVMIPVFRATCDQFVF